MDQPVRCPHCDELSRVPESAVGHYVACPNCQKPFSAIPETIEDEPEPPPREVPTVYAAKKRPVPVLRPVGETDDEFDTADPDADANKSVLFGLALLPFVIPLLWILGPTLTGKDAIFTFALPMAIAVSSTFLCLGVVLAADWSFATRVKSILAIVFVMHFLAGLLYFMKTEWVEAIRKHIGRNNDAVWQPFAPPDRKYEAIVPGVMQEDDQPIIPGWTLKCFRTGERLDLGTFYLAHGRQPVEFDNQPAEKFFEAVKPKLLEASNGTSIEETKQQPRLASNPGREFVIVLPEKNNKRILRVFRIEQTVFIAAVEGVFLTPDTADVKEFFNRLRWNKR